MDHGRGEKIGRVIFRFLRSEGSGPAIETQDADSGAGTGGVESFVITPEFFPVI